MTAARAAVLAEAASQIGTHESPAGTNRVKYTAWYGLGPVPWCDIFLAWVAAQTDATSILGRFAYTPSHANWFKARGQWHTSPQVGDLVFYDFGLGRISHVGIVEKVLSGGTIQTIEGNTDVAGGRTGGRVMRKTRSTSLVVGYGRPAYATVHASAETRIWQGLLAFAPSRRDGLWGPATDQRSQWLATAARYKAGTLAGSADSTIRLIQRVIGTPDDGQWGPASRAAVTAWTKRAQRFLDVTADGDWGPATQAAYDQLRSTNRL